MLAVEENISRSEVGNSSTVTPPETTKTITITAQKENVIPSFVWPPTSSTALKSTPQYLENSATDQQSVCECGSFEIPHPEKAYKGGEDAHFTYEGQRYTILGVADGVSGWASVGVDPGLFAKSFMKEAHLLAENGEIDPVKILEGCYQHVVGSVVGSSTACILTIDHYRNHIRAVNLGDSGFIIVRDGKVISRSTEQQHYFNAPLQLTSLLSASMDFTHMQANVFSSDPTEADVVECSIQPGDQILLATDGLFDNMDRCVLSQTLADNQDCHPQHLAEQICTMAFSQSQDPEHVSPFAIGAREAGYSCIGGKPDDVTVVVAHILDS
eukprot:gb/GECH01012545.1/.p1 GENE.gb/GECH01012545.1/~~gb/GECH01012545.1/.p1  ORF type:complete len:327 (+),score=49.56 gb/GECH01012545.1/:1-981(+)